MAVWSFIQKSQLEGAHRLDAEYFEPEYLGLEKSLLKTNFYTAWGNLKGKFITGPFGSEFNVENYSESIEYRYVRGKDVKEFFLLDDDSVYIPKKDYERLQKYSLQNGDILISVVGTLGNSAIVCDKNLPSIFSCKSTLFRTDKLNPYYLIAYLNSKYGKNLLLRNARGQVQTGLNISDLKTLLIFTPSAKDQENIASVVKGSNKLVDESKQLYVQAENLLLEELGLKDFQPEDDLSFVVNLSDVQSAHRADAEFFQPKYDKLFKISKTPFYSLSDITTFLNHGKQPPYAEERDVPIITQRHLGQFSPDIAALSDEDTKQTTLKWCERNQKYQLKRGDLLYYSVGAYIGKTNVILEDIGKIVPAGFLTLIRADENRVDQVYLTVVLNSVVGQLQSEKWQSATAQSYIYPKDIRNFKIPVLPMRTQRKIADLVRQSHSARKKSKELLEEAKRKVEEMIEKGHDD